MTCYLKARQVWHVVSGDLQRPECQFKYTKPITADTTPLVEPHLNGAVRQRAIEARPEVEVQPSLGVEERVFRATGRDGTDQCAEAATRPILGGGTSTECLCATPRTNCGDCLPCGGGSSRHYESVVRCITL